jgi:hypothetical protein
MNGHRPVSTIFSLLFFLSLSAQTKPLQNNQCGTPRHLEQKLQENAALRERFEQKKIEFNKTVSTRTLEKNARMTENI